MALDAATERAVHEPTMPSTLPYKARCSLQRESGALYNRLYTHFTHDSAWDRLYTDASVRHVRSQSARPYKEGQGVPSCTGTLSGFVSNSTNPSAVYTHESFKPNLSGKDHVIQVEGLHPLVAKRFKQKHPVEFMCAIRPDTETTPQTLRMMGTYNTDQLHADRMGMHIPHMSPGGNGWFHPDVVPTNRPVQDHPAWATTTTAFGFGPTPAWKATNYPATLKRAGYLPRHTNPQEATAAGGVSAAQAKPSSAQGSRPRTPVGPGGGSPAAGKARGGSGHVSFSFPAVSSPLSLRPSTARA